MRDRLTIDRCRCERPRCGWCIRGESSYTLDRHDFTTFALYRCDDCGRVIARPDDEQLTRALQRGTARTLRRLRNLTRMH